MSRKITFVLLISLFITAFAFAQYDFNYVNYIGAVDIHDEASIPFSIRNNEYYIESQRLTKLAQDTYDYGDYDVSAGFAEEAIRYVQLSTEFITDELIDEAKDYLDWADSNNVSGRYPHDYEKGKNYYEAAITARSNEEWEDAIYAAMKSIETLAALKSASTLPAQYMVRPWSVSRDCLWNIAGYSWIYGEPQRWRVIYDANKSKLRDPNNPDLIEPGMILDIPSINGEPRQGSWDPNKTYGY